MSTASVPNWTPDGVLPPINVLDPSSVHRSPYRVDLTDFVLRFAVSEARRQVLDGFIRYRRALHEAGLRKGFQWLNGSFAEDVERVEGRPPNDVDVVTFYELPEGTTQRVIAEKNPQLLNHAGIREKYNVDGYFVSLGSCPDRFGQREYLLVQRLVASADDDLEGLHRDQPQSDARSGCVGHLEDEFGHGR